MAAGKTGHISGSTWRALVVALVYALVGALWIGYSDNVVARLDIDIATATRIQHYKGWGYVGITALLLFLALRYLFGRLERSRARLIDKNARLLRLNRLYHMIRAIKSALLRLRETDMLLGEACRIAVVQGRYRTAWVGLVSPDGRYLRTAAHAGRDEELFRDLNLRLDTAAPCAALQAHSSGEPIVRRSDPGTDRGTDSHSAHHAEVAVRGGQTVAAFPLRIGSEGIGVLALYSNETGAFSMDEEYGLLREIADNLALGIAYLRRGRELESLNLYDSITGLANRQLFEQRLTQALARAERRHYAVAVVIVDVDGFRNINHAGGRRVGDQVLQAVAQILSGLMRPGDSAARMGNDEFAVLLVDLPASDQVSIPVGRMTDALTQQVDLDGHTVYLSASLGVAVYPDDGGDADDLITHAELALRSQPQAHRSTVSYYGDDLNAEANRRRRIELAMRASMDSAEFSLAWQPIQKLDGRIIGAEALLRWHHPELGSISPATFIPIAEQTGLIGRLGDYVMRTACAQASAWSDHCEGALQIAVNVAVQQFRDPGFVEQVEALLKAYGNPRWQLVLEITESEFILDPEAMVATCARLRALGCAIHIDDFGTGYSALSYLTRLPANAIKIDRSFVIEAGHDDCARAIIDAVVTLARRLDLGIIAEGVETREQRELMSRLGCDAIQGFLVGHPQNAATFARDFLKNKPD